MDKTFKSDLKNNDVVDEIEKISKEPNKMTSNEIEIREENENFKCLEPENSTKTKIKEKNENIQCSKKTNTKKNETEVKMDSRKIQLKERMKTTKTNKKDTKIKEKTRRVRCSIRKRTTKTKKDYKEANEMEIKEKIEKFQCSECCRGFRTLWLYEGHMRKHLGDDTPYHCQECPVKFKNNVTLYRHMYDKHNVPKKRPTIQVEYKCNFCCRIFKRPDHLRNHENGVHKKIKPFACSYCDRCFTLELTKRIHEMQHTGECPFVCHICGKQYRKVADLRIHREIHTTPPELLCRICKRAQPSEEELQAHLAKHEARNRFQCPKCGMVFKRAATLREHDNAVHMKLRPYICRYCERGFAKSSTLTEHERTHTGERPEKCTVCSATFKSKSALILHKKRHETQ